VNRPNPSATTSDQETSPVSIPHPPTHVTARHRTLMRARPTVPGLRDVRTPTMTSVPPRRQPARVGMYHDRCQAMGLRQAPPPGSTWP